MITQRVPATVELALAAAVVGVLIAFPLASACVKGATPDANLQAARQAVERVLVGQQPQVTFQR